MRIGIFYDGQFFSEVGNYYARGHARRSRLSLVGLHEFVVGRVAAARGVDRTACELVERHYFRGRYSDESMRERGTLEAQQRFDAALARSGIVAHYRPMNGRKVEKGVDVAFALEALAQTLRSPLDACVLVACDSDYVPLVEKLRWAGAYVVVLGWSFEFREPNGREVVTRTATALYDAADLALRMDAEIDAASAGPQLDSLFLSRRPSPEDPAIVASRGRFG